MSEFIARLGTDGGDVVERTFVSENEEALRRELDQKGFYVFSVRAKSGSSSILSVFRRSKRLPTRDFMVFNHEFATLLRAGLPVLQGLDMLLERMENPLFKEVLRGIRDEVRGGTSLSDAFGAHPEYFPPLYASSLQAGERSGELESVIRRFITYTKIVEAVRKKVSQALVYPVILLGSSMVVVYVLLSQVIPKFATMYETFDHELPMLTKVMIALSNMLNQYWWLGIGIGLVLFVGVSLWRQTESGRIAVDGLKLRTPIVGPILEKFAVSQLTRALSTLLRGGIPLVSALTVSAGSVGNRLISAKARGAVKTVRDGGTLSTALDETGVLQPLVIEMVKVGEATGALDEMLENVSEYYDEEIDESLNRLLTMLEPALLIGMGGVIAIMLLAMYLPLFELQSVAV